MNLSKVLFPGFFVAIALNHSLHAQSKEVSYAEVFRMEQAALSLLRSIPNRSVMTSWVYPERGKEATYKNVFIREITHTDRLRQISEELSSGKSERRELVSIGEKNYQRFNNGPWQVLDLPKNYGVWGDPAPPVSSKPRFETSARLIETVNEKNGPVSIYETISKSTREEGGKEISQIVTSRYWFRYDGLLLKKARELETVGEPRILKNLTVYEYEEIKIEAPIP